MKPSRNAPNLTSLNLQLAYLSIDLKHVGLKVLAFYLFIRMYYTRNRIIYNYKPKDLARITKLHEKTVKRYVKKLINAGFCSLQSGHLVIHKPRKILAEHGYTGRSKARAIDIRKHYRLERVIDKINLVLLEDKKIQQITMIALSLEDAGKGYSLLEKFHNALSVKEFTRAHHDAKKMRMQNKGLNKHVFTVKSISVLLGVSVPTASKYLKRLEQYGRIQRKKVFEFFTFSKDLKIKTRYYLRRGFFRIYGLDGVFSERSGKIFQYLGFSVIIPSKSFY